MLRRIKGIKKIPINLPWYWQKSFNIRLCIKRTIHRNHWPRLKKTRKKMQTTLENKKKVTIDFPRSVFKKKIKVEKRGVSSSRVKKEHEIIDLRAHKMMRGRVKPLIMPTIVKVVLIVV